MPAWDSLNENQKRVYTRQMEVYAGFLEHTDHHVGRLIDAIDDLGVLDDTLVYYIIGDNGASAEGTINGTFNEMFVFNGAAALETPEFVTARIDEFLFAGFLRRKPVEMVRCKTVEFEAPADAEIVIVVPRYTINQQT